MASHRVRNALAIAGSALAACYAFETARYKRTSARGFDLAEPLPVGSSRFARLCEALIETPVCEGSRVEVLRNGCEIFPSMLEAIKGARESLVFETYLYWRGDIGSQLAEALAERAAAGIAVRAEFDASAIFEYERTSLHAKTLVIDDSWATVGSNNFNNRSFSLNDEVTLSVWDAGIAAELAKHFTEDLDDSHELDLAERSSRPLSKRVAEYGTAMLRKEL